MSGIDYKALADKMTAGYEEIGKLMAEQKINMEEYQARAKKIQDEYSEGLLAGSKKKEATVTATYDKAHFKIDVKFSLPTEIVTTLHKDDYFGVFESSEQDVSKTHARLNVTDFATRDGSVVINFANSHVKDDHEYVVKFVSSSAYKALATSAAFKIEVPAGAKLAEAKDAELVELEAQFARHQLTKEQFDAKIKQYADKDPTGSRAKALKHVYHGESACVTFTPSQGNAKVCSKCNHGEDHHKALIKSGVTASAAPAVESKSTMLDDKVLEDLIVKDLATNKGMLIYAGAGVSMSAPSCSPSWWRLMNELLQCTFAAVPEKFKSKNWGSDLTRQPEEIMESYFYLIRDKLFSLFKLLEAGSPNANHIAMAKLAKAGKVKAILTTNFDIFIERALKQEHVAYKTVVTAEEFEDYLKHGCKEFAVLKIHGTIERPNTIVAVANHYKMGKGFSGAKADVLAYFINHYPTLFLGYSGWDFEHANYQSFWKRVGAEKGKDIFWLTLKGFGGGPDLDRILGTHIGSRLHIGAGMLPDFGSQLLAHYSKDDAAAVMTFNKSIDNEKTFKEIEQKRAVFLKDWIGHLPKTATCAFILLEAQRLNSAIQEAVAKNRKFKDENEAGVDASEFQGTVTEWGMQMAMGKLTKEEFDRRILSSTTDTVFRLLPMPRARKVEFKKKVITTAMGDAFFNKNYGIYRSLFPTLVMQWAKVSEENESDEAIMKKAIDWLHVLDAMPDDTPLNKARRQIFQSCVVGLGYKGEEAKQFPIWQEELAQKCAAENMMDTSKGMDGYMKFNEMLQKMCTKISDTVLGAVDTEAVASYMINELNHIPEKNVAEYLENASMLAIGMIRQAAHRAQQLRMSKPFQDKINTKLVPNFEVDISDDDCHACEEDLNSKFKPVLDRLHKMEKAHQTAKGENSPTEVLAAFDLATAYLWYELLKYNSKYMEEQHREHEGHYAHERIPPFAVKYISKKMQSSKLHVHDERIAQPLYAMMTILGESSKNLSMIKEGVELSLKLTQGKVTELTPYPIPESLAVFYQEDGKDDEALKWFEMALNGIKTCVSRLKVDSIVLNACSLQAKKNPSEALRWAFTYSPKFVPSQDFTLPGPGREILVRKATEWAHKLGFADIAAAKAKLMSSSH